jgi:hypothetical protein
MKRTHQEDTRGAAILLDFITAMVILLAAFGIFTFFGAAMIESIGAEDPESDVKVMRSGNIIADDYLSQGTDKSTVDPGCTLSFFSKSPDPSCGHYTSWEDDSYLSDALHQENVTINVTIKSYDSGAIQSIGGTKLALGTPLEDVAGETTYEWHRYIALDANGDGDATIHRLEVTIW